MKVYMSEEFVSERLLWQNHEEPWEFPIFDPQENGDKILIKGSRIGAEAGNLSNDEREEASPPGRRKRSATAASNKHGGARDSDDHIWTERERRKKMRNMFANLHALIPNIHPRADKSTIVDEAIDYIRKLDITLESLEKAKKEMQVKGGGNVNPTTCDPTTMITQSQLSREAFMAENVSTSTQGAVTLASPNLLFSGPTVFKTWTSPNLTLNVCGKDAHISICCLKKLGFFTTIFFVMARYKLQLVSAQVSSNCGTRMYMIHARINGSPNQEAFFPVEEIFKQAAAEIMFWLNS